jgi:diguanylate cyclase (GGDEF)-like protein/PAS domain S-box-containing protein
MREALERVDESSARLRGRVNGFSDVAGLDSFVSQSLELQRLELQSVERADSGLTDPAFEHLPCLAMLVRDGLVIARNELARRLTGFSAMPEAAVPVDEVLLEACSGLDEPPDGQRLRFDCRVKRKHGLALPVSAVAQKIESGGAPCTLLLMLEPASEGALEARPEGALLEDLLEATPGATVVTHGGRVLHVNAEFARMFDYSQMETVGRDLDELVVPDGRLHEAEMIEHQLERTGRASFETQRRTRTGRNLDVLMMASPLRLGGEERGLFVTYRDIHQQKQEEARLRHTALHDGLTGLANRSLFLNRAELTLSRLRRRPDRRFAIFFIDLDGFKKVNDELGHAAGDAVLLEVAERLRRCLRPQDTVARFGGDEFALLLDETGSEHELERVATRLQTEIGRVILLENSEARVSASIGIAMADTGYADADAMLHDADRAMYEAKNAGKARYCVCDMPGALGDEAAR